VTPPKPDPFELVGPHSVPAMRRWITALRDLYYPSIDTSTLADAHLVATELATNALEHAAAPRFIHVTALSSSSLRIEVDDATPDRDPTPGTSSLGADRGRGLAIVSALARWGVRHHRGGKTLWAEIPADPA
jgi:two-component sensor histidine kinase